MSDSLFAEDAKVERIDWMNEVARKRYGMPDRWRWFISEVKNHNLPSAFIMLTGAVCDVKYERGKRKGYDNWKMRDKATEAVVPVKFTDIPEIQREWELQTGKCANCQGTGKYICGWDHETGVITEPCKPCSATGVARSSQQLGGARG